MAFVRHESSLGPVVYRSSLLDEVGVRHGFSTRIGGVSGGPGADGREQPEYASLNFGSPHELPKERHDNPENIRRNIELLRRAVFGERGASDGAVPFVRSPQVHGGTTLVLVSGGRERQRLGSAGVGIEDLREEPTGLHVSATAADAMVTRLAGAVLVTRVADCLPILIAARDGSAVGAIHAGWRGITGGIIGSGFGALNAAWGIGPGDVVAAIGPGIGREKFEVGADVAREIAAAAPGDGVVHPHAVPGKAMVDLAMAAGHQLRALGVPPHRIDIADLCTASRPEEFFSHRRDGGVTGRMIAVIAAGA